MLHKTAGHVYTLALAQALTALAGCGSMTQYVIRQAFGEVTMLLRSDPINDVLAAGTLDAEQQRKLQLVTEARDFAQQQLGLQVDGSFHLFHQTGDKPVAYNLSAARQDSLTPKSWQFPIVGRMDFLGFFSRKDADRAAADLAQQGYDTYIYAVDAFSTQGWFPDPVHSSFLNRSDGSLVETVVHELAHNTIYSTGQSTFNESLATYIGRLGARLFYQQRGEEGQQTIAALETGYADQDRITAWMLQVEAELREYYAREVPAEEKIAGRDAVFQAARQRFVTDVQPQLSQPDRYSGWANLPTNNAYVLLHRRYNLDLDVFAAVYERSAGDMAAFLDVLRAAAKTDDPFAYLRQAAGSP